MNKWILALLVPAIAIIVFLAGAFYHWGRTQPGGDAVRQRYLERHKCQAEAQIVYERCMGER